MKSVKMFLESYFHKFQFSYWFQSFHVRCTVTLQSIGGFGLNFWNLTPLVQNPGSATGFIALQYVGKFLLNCDICATDLVLLLKRWDIMASDSVSDHRGERNTRITLDSVLEAIGTLKEANGSTLTSLKKYFASNLSSRIPSDEVSRWEKTE
jgi:hypothetical protein